MAFPSVCFVKLPRQPSTRRLLSVFSDQCLAAFTVYPGQRWPRVVDVTRDESVRRAAELVSQRATSRLLGVVNNAGVSAPTPLELADIGEMRRVLETLSEGLRLEPGRAGIRVVVVEPGLTDTGILEKARSQYTALTARLDDRELACYQDYIQVRAAMTASASHKGMPPDRVARVIEHALTTRRPRQRYFASADVRGACVLGRIAPRRIRDLALTHLLGFPGVDRRRG